MQFIISECVIVKRESLD